MNYAELPVVDLVLRSFCFPTCAVLQGTKSQRAHRDTIGLVRGDVDFGWPVSILPPW